MADEQRATSFRCAFRKPEDGAAQSQSAAPKLRTICHLIVAPCREFKRRLRAPLKDVHSSVRALKECQHGGGSQARPRCALGPRAGLPPAGILSVHLVYICIYSSDFNLRGLFS